MSYPQILIALYTALVIQVALVAKPSTDISSVSHLTPIPENTSRLLTNWTYLNPETEEWEAVQVPRLELPKGGILPTSEILKARAEVTLSQDWDGQLIKFRSQSDDVQIDGQQAVFNNEYSEPYEADITQLVQAGKTHTIELQFRNINAHQIVGLLENAYFFAVPTQHIDYVYITPSLDADYDSGSVRVRYGLTNTSTEPWPSGQLKLRLTAPDGTATTLSNSSLIRHPEVEAGTTAHLQFEADVESPLLWHLETPEHLYTLEIQAAETSTQTRFGFRQLDIKNGEVLLNGQIIKLPGANFEPFPWLMNEDSSHYTLSNFIRLYRDANTTFLRLGHRNERLMPPSATAVADELGVALQFPLFPITFYGEKTWRDLSEQEQAAQTEAWVSQALEEMAEQFNHPSILIWEIANESHWNPGFAAVHEAILSFDQSRLRDFTWNRESDRVPTDLADWHYPGADAGKRTIQSERPVIFGEFCSEPKVGAMDEHDAGLVPTWGRTHEAMWDSMYHGERCLGGAVWIGNNQYAMDQMIKQVEGRQRRHFGNQPDWEDIVEYFAYEHEALGHASCIDAWQRPLPGFYNHWKNYSPLRVEEIAQAKGGSLVVTVENRHHITDLSQLDITWRSLHPDGTENERGTAYATGAPMSQGSVHFTPKETFDSGSEFELVFTNVRGHTLDRVRVWAQAKPQLNIDWPTQAGASITENTPDKLTVQAGVTAWEFDPGTDKLSRSK